MSIEVEFQNQTVLTSSQTPQPHYPSRSAQLTKTVIWFALAIVSIFIPVAHFVLVPLFTILGISAVTRMNAYQTYVETMRFKCLQCPQFVEIKLGQKIQPVEECPSCKAAYCVRVK